MRARQHLSGVVSRLPPNVPTIIKNSALVPAVAETLVSLGSQPGAWF